MYFVDALKVLARQWLVVLVGLAAVAGAAFAVVRVVPTEYQASGQLMLLLPTSSTGRETPTNPYLNLPAELTTTASLLAGTMMTKDTVQALEDERMDSEYDVAVVPGAGPLLIITTRDTDPERAIDTRDGVMSRLDQELDLIQIEANVPETQLIRLLPFSVGSTAEALPGSKIRALAVVGGVGMTVILLVAFARDRRRRRRRAETEEDSGASDPGAAAVPPEPEPPTVDERPLRRLDDPQPDRQAASLDEPWPAEPTPTRAERPVPDAGARTPREQTRPRRRTPLKTGRMVRGGTHDGHGS